MGTLGSSYFANNKNTAIMEEKLSVLYAADQLTTDQYQELMKMLEV